MFPTRPWLTLLLIAGPVYAAPTRVDFYRDIAPIIYHNCSSCHRPGESAPFSLLSYEDVKRRDALIADVTRQRYMPPWLPQAGYGDFSEERRLTDAQIDLIQQWVKNGSPAGTPTRASVPPKFADEWQLGTPDLILRADKPYELAADGPEVFWNFIMHVPITTTRWIRAMEVRPGNARVFHHANVIIDRARSSRRREVSPGAGFPGMDLRVEEESFDPDGHFLSWKPGSEPVVEPDGMAWRADPGMDLVLNVHMKRSGKTESVSPMIGLYFTDKPQTKFPYLVQLEHDGAIDIPAGDADFVISDDFRTSMDLNVLAVYPHAHYLAKVMEAYATLPDGSKQWLIRIPQWDLNWQGVFRLRKPLFLPRGTVVSMRYHYDNSADNVRNPNSPPKRVLGGNSATDEMSHFWLQVLPAEPGDHRAQLEEDMMRGRLLKYPDDFTANYNLGDVLLNKGDAAAAIPHFTKAAEVDPNNVVAANELGVALFSASKATEAEEQLKKALAIDVTYTDARFNLASVEASNAEWEAAAADFTQVLKERPEDARAAQHLGEVMILWGDQLAKAGKDPDAVLRYRDALARRPSDKDLLIRLGMALARLERLDESQQVFETLLRVEPNSTLAKQAIDAIIAHRKALGK
ncbi:MAG TPA: tetratricopeptide repeat protein [Bryobacteraceae bacterium]|jgi:tetratricopeptide (TPR) repeat protein/mono/diheme cytochrome c family protein